MPRALACPAAAFIAAAFLLPAAHALDCTAAESRSEQAICADPALQAADDSLTAAFGTVLKAAAPDARPMMEANQKSWIARRERSCDGAEAMPTCLLAMTNHRTAYLTATPANGPGLTPPLVPDLRFTPAADETCGADASVYRFAADAASPAAQLITARIEEIFAGFQSSLGPNLPEQNCSYIAEAELAFATPQFVNIAIHWTGFPVGSYSDTGWTSIFADLNSGTLLAFGDLFPDSARGPLAEACTASLREEKVARLVRSAGGPGNADMAAIAAEVDADLAARIDSIAARVGDLAYWRVTAEGATVDFGFSAGMYMDGTFECRLPKPLLVKVERRHGSVVE